MAEEVNTSEQEQTPQPTLPTAQQDNQPDVSFLQYLPESIKTPARPSAISIYSKYVGNPLTGSDPGERFMSSGQPRVDPMQAAVTKSLTYENKYAALKPFTYSGDSDKANFERYYSARDTYNKLGFNPYADNESLYNKNMTFGDRFVRAAGQWDNLIASGFKSGVRSWKTIFTDPLAPDIEGAAEMEKIMAVGADNTGGLGAFFNNVFLNSGYTVGIGLNYLGEELALMGATALSGGVAGSVGIPAMVARTGVALNKIFEGSKIIGGALKNLTRMDGVRSINSIPEARSFWSTVGKGARAVGKGAFEIVNPLENTYQALKATDYATDFAKLSRTFGAFADDLLMMKNVVAEAKIEGGLAKINATKELIDLYVAQNNGKQPEGKDLKDIEEIATKEAYRTAALNLPAIGVTNRLMYATMLAPLRNVMGKEAVPLLEDIIFNKKTFSALGEGLVEKGSAALKSLSKPKFYGQFGMNYLKANFAEGIQENLQEAISYGAIQHAKATYNNPVRAAHDGYMTDLMDGLRQQFSVQGAETFASGFLMGAFAQPIMALPSVGISRLVRSFNTEKYEQEKQLKKERIQRDIDILNEQYQSPLDFYAPDLANAVKTGSLADDMYAAGKAGNKKEAMDAQDAIQNQHMITAFRTGKYDIIRKRLADYENFTAEETIEAFKKYGIEEKDYEKASAKIKEVIARADRTKEVYENVAKKYPNPINVSNYKRGTPEREAAEISKMAWDEAVSNLVFAHATMDSHSKRIADIAKTFSAISNDMAGEDAQSLMSMLSTTTLAKEVVALANEVKVLDDNIPAQKKIKAKKEKQLEKIDKYFSAIKDIEEAKTPEEKAKAEEKAKDAFGDYVKFLANKNEKLIFDDSLEDAYNMVRDSMLLKNDMKGLVDSINVLMTPQNFLNLHARLYNAHEEMFKNRESIINNNVNLHHEIKDTNDAINLIYQENKLNLSPESLDAIKEAKDKNENLPANITFVDEDGNAVTSGPRFENAMKTWKVLLDLTKKEAKPVEEKIEEEETEEEEVEQELQPFDPEDVSTYPDSLMNDLEDMYELYKESSLIDEGDTFDMFLKTQTAKVIIKNAELAVKLQEERKEKKPDLLQRINNAGTPEELDEIDAEIQKAGALTKELIDATNKKRESFKKTTTTPTDIEAKRAEIIQTNNPTIQTVGNVTFGIANKQGTTEDNEDAVYVDTQNGIFILADGMGGEVSPITTAKDTSKNVINILLGNTTQTIFDQIVGIADKYEIKDVAKFVEDIRKLTGYSFKNTTSINNLFFAIKRKESLNNVKNQRTGATSLKALKKGKNTYIIEKVGDTVFFIVDKNGKVIQSHGLSDVATTQGYMFSIKDGKPFVSSPKTDNFTITLNEGETLVLATDFIETNKAIQDFIDSDFGKNLNFAKFQKNNKQDDSTFITIKYDAELAALEGKPTTAPVSDEEAKKAEIERRKKLSLQGIEEGAKIGSEEATYYGPNWDPSNMTTIVENITTVYGKTKQELINKIEELYNAELEALEGKPTTDVEAKKAELERTRQEEISKIVSKYFPNSKFTDILYHGTRGQERFEKFDENRMGELDSGYFGKGFYLTPERAYAEGYAKPYNGIVLYTVVNLENPLVTDANQANTGITLENNDGAIVKLGEDTLGISEEKYDPNQVIEVVLKKADQIQILSEEESRKVDEINAEYNAKLEALEGTTPTDIKDKKADIINKLFEKNILTPLNNGNTWMLDGDGRIFVVANINGNKVLFYTSSEGTSGKTEGAWYPVIGISNTGYIIKGTKDSTNSKYNFNEGYGIKEIKDFQDFLNRNITNVKGKDLETLKSIFGDNVQTNISYKVNKEFDLAPFINSTYKVQDKKLTFGGYLSREEAIDIWLDRFKAKEVKQNINAELAALEQPTDIETKKADIERRREKELKEIKSHTGSRTQAKSIQIGDKTFKLGEKIYLSNVNVDMDDSTPSYRTGTYTISMISLNTDLKNGIITLGDGNELITPKISDIINAKYDAELSALEDKTAEETGKKTKYKKPRKKKTKDGKQLTIDLEGSENINENYKGAIIYMTPSSIVDLEGYPTVMNTDDISIDFIIEQVPNVNLKWYAETYKNEHNWKSQVIYDAIAHMGVDGNKLREKVSKRAKELAAEGYTVLTGSNYYVKDADYVMIQTNPEINKNMPNYPIQNAIYEAKVENKPVILINQMFNEALKQTPQELSDKDLEFINEDSEITIEDINKKITQKGLYIARDRGYDVFYKNKRYAIVNISGNSVSLSSIDGEKINVKVSEISSVVDPTGGQASKSDISTFKNNENNIQSGKVNIDFEEKNINKVIKDIEDNIC